MNVPSLNGNWVDLVILVVIVYFVAQGLRVGFWPIVTDFAGFLVALGASLFGFGFLAGLLRSNFSLSHSFSNALGFLLTAVLVEGGMGLLFSYLLGKIPKKIQKFPYSKPASIPFALGEAVILVSFIMTLVVGLPIASELKADVVDSKIGGFLVQKTSGIEARIKDIFGGVIEDSLTYLTVEPGSSEAIPITTKAQKLTVDEKNEKAMFNLVNEERRKRGIRELVWSPEIVPVARDHARDMWERSYFGHYSPEGKDVGDRLDEAGIDYRLAGENLALAPTLSTAHTGLMNSEGHRANILEEDFRKVGIGVIDNGIYGKMFVQVFTN